MAKLQDHIIFNLLHNKKSNFELDKFLLILEDINIKNKYDSGILHYAIYSGNSYVLNFCIEKSADLNIKNFMGETPLMWALRKLDIDSIKYLLEHGANPKLKNNNKEDIFSMIGSWVMFPSPEKVEDIKELLKKYI
jgi:ankyrin repeat protein